MSNKTQQSTNSLPVGFTPIPESLEAKFQRDFPIYNEGIVRSEPGNYVTTPFYAKAANQFYNMNLKADDVFVLSFPKCGKSFFSKYLM